MQTFLPYPDFVATAAALDDRRLGKQRVECFQILRALVWRTYGWKNHPAVVMWRGFSRALVRYSLDVCDEWLARGRADTVRGKVLEFAGGIEPSWADLTRGGELPPWLGDEALHVSHRAALLRKDPDFYAAWKGEADPDAPYVWPGSLFPVWPLPEGPAWSLRSRASALKYDDIPTEAVELLARLRRGEDGRLPNTVEGRRAALLALLELGGAAVWLRPGSTPHRRHRPAATPDGVPQPLPALSRGASAQVAREPGPEDRAAMLEEVLRDPVVRVLRAGDRPRLPPGTSAVIVEPGLRRPRWQVPAVRLE